MRSIFKQAKSKKRSSTRRPKRRASAPRRTKRKPARKARR